jgi:hypothetical protein
MLLGMDHSILTAAWSGEPVHHRGQHYTVDGIQLRPFGGRPGRLLMILFSIIASVLLTVAVNLLLR